MLLIQSIHAFDRSIALFFNQFIGEHPFFDALVFFQSNNNLLKAGLIMLTIWGLWFIQDAQTRERRIRLSMTILASLLAIAVGRFLVMMFPHRMRPINDPSLGLHIPEEINMYAWDALSSFPSDHAVLFYALSVSLFVVSKRVGIFFMLSSLVLILFPRVYLGYHYATDLIVGALVGAAIGYFVTKSRWVYTQVERYFFITEKYQQFFYPFMFLVTYQFCEMFSDIRAFFDIMK